MPRRRADHLDLDDLARYRGGIVTYAELNQARLPPGTLAYRIRDGGPWQPVLPGVIALHNGPLTTRQRLDAAMAYARPGAVMTGSAAVRLRGLRSAGADTTVDVLVPHARTRSSHSFVRVQRTRRMPTPVLLDGLAVAPVARAVIDAARRMTTLRSVRALVAEAVQRGLCTPAELVDELRAGNMRWSARARAVLKEIEAGVRSVAEADARAILSKAGVRPAQWNKDLFDADGHWLARPDAVWLDVGVVLEIDSLEWHLSPEAYRRTQERQRRLARAGVIVLAFTPGSIRADPQAFVQEVRDTLARAAGRVAPELVLRDPR